MPPNDEITAESRGTAYAPGGLHEVTAMLTKWAVFVFMGFSSLFATHLRAAGEPDPRLAAFAENITAVEAACGKTYEKVRFDGFFDSFRGDLRLDGTKSDHAIRAWLETAERRCQAVVPVLEGMNRELAPLRLTLSIDQVIEEGLNARGLERWSAAARKGEIRRAMEAFVEGCALNISEVRLRGSHFLTNDAVEMKLDENPGSQLRRLEGAAGRCRDVRHEMERLNASAGEQDIQFALEIRDVFSGRIHPASVKAWAEYFISRPARLADLRRLAEEAVPEASPGAPLVVAFGQKWKVQRESAWAGLFRVMPIMVAGPIGAPMVARSKARPPRISIATASPPGMPERIY